MSDEFRLKSACMQCVERGEAMKRFRLSTLMLVVVIAALCITVVLQERQYGLRLAESHFMLAVSRERAFALEAQAAARELNHERRFAEHLAEDKASAEGRAKAERALSPAAHDLSEESKVGTKDYHKMGQNGSDGTGPDSVSRSRFGHQQ
jgi:hypothetical protein